MKQKFKLYIFYILKESVAFILFIPGIIFLKVFGHKKNKLFILNYHNFSKYNNYRVKRGNMLETGYSKNFENQIKFLNKYFNFCYPEKYFSKKGTSDINILITFDDGYKDNYDVAFPILKKHNIPTIFFVATKYINSENYIIHDIIKYLIQEDLISRDFVNISQELYLGKKNYSEEDMENLSTIFKANLPNHRLMMNNEEVKALCENGFKIQNHTYSHERLSFLSKKDQFESIQIASNDIEEICGVKPTHIAYPNGLFNNDTLEVVDKLNLDYGYTVIGGYNSIGDNKKTLKRIGVNASDSKYVVVLKLVLYSTFKFGKI